MSALLDDCLGLMRKDVDCIKALQAVTNRELTPEESEAIVRYAKLIASMKNARRGKLSDKEIADALDALPPEVRKHFQVQEDDE